MTVETPRMVIVPAMPTRKMGRALEEFINPKSAWYHAVRLSPGSGKISRADLARAFDAAAEAEREAVRAARREMGALLTPSRDVLRRVRQDAFCAAFGLEIAEDGENG